MENFSKVIAVAVFGSAQVAFIVIGERLFVVCCMNGVFMFANGFKKVKGILSDHPSPLVNLRKQREGF